MGLAEIKETYLHSKRFDLSYRLNGYELNNNLLRKFKKL